MKNDVREGRKTKGQTTYLQSLTHTMSLSVTSGELKKNERHEEQYSLTQYTCENERKGTKPGDNKSIFKERSKESKIRRGSLKMQG